MSYEKKKQKLVAQFQALSLEKSPVSLKKESSNLFRVRGNKTSSRLDVRDFNQLISIDSDQGLATVEAMITYENFVRETLIYGYLPAVVPQLKTITVGGAITGLGIEASSFRYGLVHETVTEIDILTGEGRVLTCTPDNAYRDLFYGFPNSYGTLGYALRVTLKLIRAKKYVKSSYRHFTQAPLFFDALQKECQKGEISFIDGVIFSSNSQHLATAEFVDEAPYLSDYSYMNIYYQSIPLREEDYLTTSDYIWRWDADWFWCSKRFGMHNKILRFLVGKWVLHSRVYWKMMHTFAKNRILKAARKFFEQRREAVIQDVLIPIQHAAEFYDFFKSSIGITPIWICPAQSYQGRCETPLYSIDPSTLYLDFGFWDTVPSSHPAGYFNRMIEHKAKELQGFKSLYSDSYYTEEEFWSLFPKEEYFSLKKRYDPHSVFSTLFKKCVH